MWLAAAVGLWPVGPVDTGSNGWTCLWLAASGDLQIDSVDGDRCWQYRATGDDVTVAAVGDAKGGDDGDGTDGVAPTALDTRHPTPAWNDGM